MGRTMKASLTSMMLLTMIYLGVVMVVNANSRPKYLVYGAFIEESEVPPDECYTPEQLGIVEIIEHGASYLELIVDSSKEPFPLQEENPVFAYKHDFYRVSSLWVTPRLRTRAVPLLGVRVVLVVVFVFAAVYILSRFSPE